MEDTSPFLETSRLGKAPAVSFAPAPSHHFKRKKVSMGLEVFPPLMTLKDGFSLANADGSPLHAVKLRNRLFSKGPVLFTLHTGASESSPVLAIAKYAPDTKQCMVVEIPPTPASDVQSNYSGQSEDEAGWRFTQYSKTEALGGITKAEHCFSGEINGREETFVWQFTKDVDKSIGKVGWELIRVTRGRNELMAVWGFTKDGFTRKRAFAFMEAGMKFGAGFEIAAVMTMIRVDWLYQQA